MRRAYFKKGDQFTPTQFSLETDDDHHGSAFVHSFSPSFSFCEMLSEDECRAFARGLLDAAAELAEKRREKERAERPQPYEAIRNLPTVDFIDIPIVGEVGAGGRVTFDGAHAACDCDELLYLAPREEVQ